jgi:hypothetical protein
MRRLPFLLTVIALSMILGEPAAGGDKKAPPNYFPLKEGSKSYYRVEIPGQPALTAIIHLAKIETIDGVALARLEMIIQGQINATEHVSSDERGIFRHRYNGSPINKPLCLLKNPVNPGESWQQDCEIGTEKAKIMCKVGHEEEVTVPAGKFKAIPVFVEGESGGMKATNTYWFAAEVGMVKQTIELGGAKFSLELEKREVPK